MKLRHKNLQMKEKAISVEGVRYKLDADCVVEVPDEVAEVLLQGAEWSKHRAPEAQEAAQEAPKPEAKPTPPKGASKAPAPAAKAAAPGSEPATPPEEPQEEPQEGPEESQDPEGKAASDDEGNDQEWPDPDENMTKAYLQEMADAYEVTYTDKTTKKQLVAAIMEKMYG